MRRYWVAEMRQMRAVFVLFLRTQSSRRALVAERRRQDPHSFDAAERKQEFGRARVIEVVHTQDSSLLLLTLLQCLEALLSLPLLVRQVAPCFICIQRRRRLWQHGGERVTRIRPFEASSSEATAAPGGCRRRRRRRALYLRNEKYFTLPPVLRRCADRSAVRDQSAVRLGGPRRGLYVDALHVALSLHQLLCRCVLLGLAPYRVPMGGVRGLVL